MGGGGWLEKVGIRLSQLSTKLKLKLKLSLAKHKLSSKFSTDSVCMSALPDLLMKIL